MLDTTDHNPFKTAHLLDLPPIEDDDPSTVWTGFHFEQRLESTLFSIPAIRRAKLPELELHTFQLSGEDVALESLDASSTSAYDTADDEGQPPKEQHGSESDFDDLWVLPDVQNAPRANKLTSWDHFLREDHKEPPSMYLAEAGAEVFDAVLASDNAADPPQIAPTDDYLDSLLDLAMGRSTRFAKWDVDMKEFVLTASRLTVSGCSPELISEMHESVAAMGQLMRWFSERISSPPGDSTQGHLAFTGMLASILAALEHHLHEQRKNVTSFVQLQQVLDRPRQLIVGINRMTDVVTQSTSDISLLSALLDSMPSIILWCPGGCVAFNKLLSAASVPVLAALSSVIGLESSPSGTGSEEDHGRWSALFSTELAQLVSEAMVVLQILRAQPQIVHEQELERYGGFPTLQLLYSGEELALLHREVGSRELQQRSENKEREEQQSPLTNAYATAQLSMPDSDPMQFQQINFDAAEMPVQHRHQELQCQLAACFSETAFQGSDYPIPYDQVLEVSVAATILAQHRLLSYSALRLLFTQGHVRAHLSLLHDFQLFGNGLFASRVSTALFDSGQSSGEGRRRDGSTTGLRLQDRDTWPPASSELRLVLMGILSEYLPMDGRGLEDSISFSLRDLSDEELERCRDVDSIHALDFLRVHYKPPTAILEAVVSSESLDKYDRIFKHLLRLLRLRSVAQDLLQEISTRNSAPVSGLEHRFRVQLHHFTSTLADYSQNTAIGYQWAKFDKQLMVVERAITDDDYTGTLRRGRSLEHLRKIHEEMLDNIVRALMLKERQVKIRRSIEGLFAALLSYAATVRRGDLSNDTERSETRKRHYDEFMAGLCRLKEILHGEDGLPEFLSLRLSMRGL